MAAAKRKAKEPSFAELGAALERKYDARYAGAPHNRPAEPGPRNALQSIADWWHGGPTGGDRTRPMRVHY